ncbi:MAG: bifunctional precorrin-2 dehydrogenase/sirohydrochlorin ferrochelatase [Coriobacteriia bacterium]|nr:bifunctional precorrin-2 dehydrogenase/sirohydrochlorin ferrochelatase [Coriobacteriia bacterium]
MSRDYTTRYYPVYLDLGDRLAVVVGGGSVAARKIRTLVDYGARVLVVAPDPTAELERLATDGAIALERRGYVRGDLDGAFLVVCATDSEEVNRAVYEEADQRGCLVNVVDVPELCNFIVPSIVRRGQLQLAISTGGAAPVVAKRLRRHIEEYVGEEWGPYIELLGEVRMLVMERVPGGEAERKPIFETIGASDLLDRIGSGERPSAEDVYAEFVGGDRP